MQELSSEYWRHSHQVALKAVKNVLLDLFINGTVGVERELENAPFKIRETILTSMSEKEALEKIFGCSTDRWTQSTSFMDAFAICALASSEFACAIARIIKTRTDETANE